ncbi:MAG TPA: hypothetical protein VMG60_16090 [Burkholderiaceae bacterium]|nr:hypothetical protein [Burkholderiaceae bacterium]
MSEKRTAVVPWTDAAAVSRLDQLYDCLKGRSDGAITRAHVEAMQ